MSSKQGSAAAAADALVKIQRVFLLVSLHVCLILVLKGGKDQDQKEGFLRMIR